MSDDILEAKRRLPLPDLMGQVGLGEHALKSAHCPFHDDKHESFSTWQNPEGLWFWKCHAGCGQGDEITFLEKHKGITNSDAIREFLLMTSVSGKKTWRLKVKETNEQTFNSRSCVDAFTDKHAEQIAAWRGYSLSFVKELRDNGQIGIYKGLVAFPVHNDGKIVGTHYRLKDGTWRYFPEGIDAAPLVFGDLPPGKPVHVFESTWDGLDYMDKTGERDQVIIARGTGNAKLAAALIPQGSTCYVWTQNDKGGADFEKALVANSRGTVKRVTTPAEFKDLNTWTLLRTKAGATREELREELRAAVKNAEVICEAPTSYPSRNAEAARDFQAEIKSADAAKREAPATRPRIAKLKKPEEPVSFEQWRDVIEANFPALVRPAEIGLCVVSQLLLNDVCNPFALAYVDVPASGKTITLNFFDGPAELTYTTDNFTPASFVSHATNVKREELGNIDLLPRIRYRTLIIRELGSIFGAKEDDLIKSLGILTRVLDGEGLETDSGVHGRRGYKGDYLFMLLAGTLPIPPRVFKIMGNFGSRLFFLCLHTPDENDDELIAQNKGTDRKLKERESRRATENFLRTLWATNPTGIIWNKADDPDDCLLVIARCARLLARLRGAINVWLSEGEGGEKLSHTVPAIEKPRRINCLFYNLARSARADMRTAA